MIKRHWKMIFYMMVAILIGATTLTIIGNAAEETVDDFDPVSDMFSDVELQKEIWGLIAPGVTFGASLLTILLLVTIVAGILILGVFGIIANAKNDAEEKRRAMSGILNILFIVLIVGTVLTLCTIAYNELIMTAMV